MTQFKSSTFMFRCSLCDFKNGLSHKFYLHLRQSHKGQYHKCYHCLKSFTTPLILVNHIRKDHEKEITRVTKEEEIAFRDHCLTQFMDEDGNWMADRSKQTWKSKQDSFSDISVLQEIINLN